jgi:hypothetical protein
MWYDGNENYSQNEYYLTLARAIEYILNLENKKRRAGGRAAFNSFSSLNV